MSHNESDCEGFRVEAPDLEFWRRKHPSMFWQPETREDKERAMDEFNYFAKQTFDEISEERAAALAAIERVRALHCEDAVSARYLAECCADECEHETCPEREVSVCHACWEAAESANSTYGEEGIKDDVLWPCPTIAALDGAPEPGANVGELV